MKEKISALMDGELAREESGAPLEALREGEARQAWRTYHLIGDAMRDTRALSGGFAARVAARISGEPTVIAPKARRPVAEKRWPALSMAAGLAAFALVVGAVFVTQQGSEPTPQVAQAPRQIEPIKEAAQVPPPDTAADYLLAHQGSSPRNSLQGMAPYVRMVSGQPRPAKP